MVSHAEAMNTLLRARDLVFERLATNPMHGVYIHASQQLERMIAQLDGNEMPTQEVRAWVNIGLMAVRELEGPDPELAGALMDADHDFKNAES